MQKTIVKYLTRLSENTATNFQKRLHKRYNGNLTYLRKNISFDIKHGVTNDQVLTFKTKSKVILHMLVCSRIAIAWKD
jgi:hypothetical protein